METEFWAGLATVIAALIAYFGVRYTAQQSQRAATISKRVESAAVEAAAFERARESYDAAIERYLKEIERLAWLVDNTRQREEMLQQRIEYLENQADEQRSEIEEVMKHLIEVRHEYEEHLRECQVRVAHLRKALESGDITDQDPDLL